MSANGWKMNLKPGNYEVDSVFLTSSPSISRRTSFVRGAIKIYRN
jgi:hypothetical protein